MRQRLELNVETAQIALKVKQASEIEIRQVVECEVWQCGNRLCRALPCGVRGLGSASSARIKRGPKGCGGVAAMV